MNAPASPAAHPFQLYDLHRRTLIQLDEALRLIESHRKQVYVEALNVCPHLVETESNPIHFLLHEKYNVWSAAERLVTYWQSRYEIFGNRCFLPMDLSGQGAMESEDIAKIKTGYRIPTCDDTIILFHNEATVNETARDRVRRMFFFAQHFLSMPPTISREAGINIISLDQNFNASNEKQKANHILYELMQTSFPLCVKAIHRVVFQASHPTLLIAILPKLLNQMGLWSSLLKIHHCSTPAEAMEKLSPHGIFPSSLPASLGGTLDLHATFFQFLIANKLPLTPTAFSGIFGLDDAETMGVLSTLTATLTNGRVTPPSYHSTRKAELPATSMVTKQKVDELNPTNDSAMSEAVNSKLQGELSKLDEAVALLPNHEKEAYQRAQLQCPDLIQKESTPATILQMEKFNVWEAAKRITAYWKNRLMIFEDRAFLPLTLTGALFDEDVSALNSGFWIVPGEDKWGRTVVCYDPSKLGNQHSMKTRLRVLFYIFNIVFQNAHTAQDGFILMTIFGRKPVKKEKDEAPWNARKMITDIFLQSFSFRPATTHVIYCPDDKKTFFGRIFPLVFKAASSLLETKAEFHVGETNSDLITAFEKLGLGKDCMPVCVGGVMDAADFLLERGKREGNFPNGCSSVLLLTRSSTSDAIALGQINEALDRIPFTEKAALSEALRSHLDLVEKEANYAKFLRFADYDANMAASLLVRYWRTRKELFGERAFQPMNQTGDGALDKKDVGVLQSAYLMQLPCDSEGRGVVCCDGSKAPTPASRSHARCSFYLFSIISDIEASQDDGFQLLYYVTNPFFDNLNADTLELVLNSIPVKLKYFHLLGIQPSQNRKVVLNQKLKAVASRLRGSSHNFLIEHNKASRGQLAGVLYSYGLEKGGLPKALCGSRGFEEFVQWQELRVRHEWGLPISLGLKETAEQLNISRPKISSDLTNEQKVERKRRMNVIHARRKRERDRMEMEALREHAMELKDERMRLKEEGVRLCELIAEAEAITC